MARRCRHLTSTGSRLAQRNVAVAVFFGKNAVYLSGLFAASERLEVSARAKLRRATGALLPVTKILAGIQTYGPRTTYIDSL